MFRDRIEENVVYIVYSENDCKIDTTIDQLMSISACSFTGHHFEPKISKVSQSTSDNILTIASSSGYQTETSTIRTNSVCRSKQPACSSSLKPGSLDRRGSPAFSPTPHGKHVGCTPNNEDSERSSEGSSVSNDSHQTVDEQIASLQRAIDDLVDEKGTCHDKASQYLSKRMFPVTSYYSELASHYRRMIEQKTQQLVDLLLVKSENADQIDLHGLNPIQARLVVGELLRIRQEKLSIDKQGQACIDIITGWGKHCVTNGQRIKPAVVSLLREKGFDYYRLNKGALRVTIRRR